MRKGLMVLFISIFHVTVFAQNQLHVKAGKTFSTFLFRDSESNKDESLKHISTTYLGVSYDILLSEKHLIRPELAYREAGARSSLNNLPLRWNLHYIDMNVSFSYQLFSNDKIQLYQGIGPSMGVLLGGEQTIGNFVYDVVDNKSLKRFDLGLNFMAHAKFAISEQLFLSLEYRYGLGLWQIESNTNQDQDQIARNRYHGVIVGLSFTL